MSTRRVVDWKDVEVMLDACAPGWQKKDKTHRRWIVWKKPRLDSWYQRGVRGAIARIPDT